MPRKAKGPRLYLDAARRQWIIRDGTNFVRTGCAERDLGGAEKQLAAYIGNKFKPQPGSAAPIASILTAYADEKAGTGRRRMNVIHTVSNLAKWWGDKTLSHVTARNCRAYAETRPPSAARRDLETLRAAIRHYHREYGPLPSLPAVTLPPKAEHRERWLTRSEAAALLRTARRAPHLARFVLLGLYTGTRAGALLALQWKWVDLEAGVMRRRASARQNWMGRHGPNSLKSPPGRVRVDQAGSCRRVGDFAGRNDLAPVCAARPPTRCFVRSRQSIHSARARSRWLHFTHPNVPSSQVTKQSPS